MFKNTSVFVKEPRLYLKSFVRVTGDQPFLLVFCYSALKIKRGDFDKRIVLTREIFFTLINNRAVCKDIALLDITPRIARIKIRMLDFIPRLLTVFLSFCVIGSNQLGGL